MARISNLAPMRGFAHIVHPPNRSEAHLGSMPAFAVRSHDSIPAISPYLWRLLTFHAIQWQLVVLLTVVNRKQQTAIAETIFVARGYGFLPRPRRRNVRYRVSSHMVPIIIASQIQSLNFVGIEDQPTGLNRL